MCLSLLMAKPTKVVGYVCRISQLSDLNSTQHDVSVVSSTCLERKNETKQNKNQNIDINLKRCTKWKEEKKKKTYSTYQCTWNVCQICSNLKPLAFEGVCESQFFVFHVDIRVDVTWIVEWRFTYLAEFVVHNSLHPFSLNTSILGPL